MYKITEKSYFIIKLLQIRIVNKFIIEKKI